jgi:hypothetical protein
MSAVDVGDKNDDLKFYIVKETDLSGKDCVDIGKGKISWRTILNEFNERGSKKFTLPINDIQFGSTYGYLDVIVVY